MSKSHILAGGLLIAVVSLVWCGGRDALMVRPLDPDADVHEERSDDADIDDASSAPDADVDRASVVDTGPDVELDAEEATDAELENDASDGDTLDGGDAEGVVDADDEPDADELPDADTPPTELSCITGAYCALCCPLDDLSCQLGCVAEAPPSVVIEVTALVGCVAASGCGGVGGALDFSCITEACGEQLAECSGGTGGTAGCLGTAWCLVSSGCAGMSSCPEQGLCYQACLDDARPEVVGVALEVLACVGTSCATDCAAGLSTAECLTCLGVSCGPALAGCLGM